MGDRRDSELKRKRLAFRGLRNDVGDKRRARELLKQYSEESKDASDDESMDGFTETQEDFCRDYFDAITKIESLDKHINSNGITMENFTVSSPSIPNNGGPSGTPERGEKAMR